MTTPAVLLGYFMVPVFGAVVCAGPTVTRPGVAFGVRVPADHAAAPVIRRERDRYVRYTAIVAACATAAVFLSWGHGCWWLGRLAYGPPAARGPAGGFAAVIGQAFVTTLWTGLALLLR